MRGWIFSIGMSMTVMLAAQERTFQGYVFDSELGEPVLGAHVVIKDADPFVGTVTDINGQFSLKLDQGRVDEAIIQVSFVGFEPQELQLRDHSSPDRGMLFIELRPAMLDAVIVESDRSTEVISEFAAVSARSISMEQADNMPGGFNDIGRVAQNFAGVQKANDSSNEIVVRGNQPGGVLWRIEGVDAPNPNHFAEMGTAGGPLSILNVNTIQGTDFFTGAFPAEYGNAMAAAFDVRLRSGSRDGIKAMSQLGFNGFEGMVEGPFKKGSDATFLLNYRNSNLTLIEKMGIIDFDVHLGVPTFNDMTFKMDLPSEIGRFSIFGVTGKSDISTEASRIIRKEGASEEAVQAAMDEGKDERYGSLTGIYGLRYWKDLSDKISLESVLSYTLSDSYLEIDTLDGEWTPHANLEQTFRETRLSGRSNLNYQISDQQLIRTGITFSRISYGLARESFAQQSADVPVSLDEEGAATLLQHYVQYRYSSASGRLSVSPGLYYQRFFLNGTQSLEPRLSATYELSESHTLNVGVGLHSQTLPLPSYFTAQTAGQDIETIQFQKSWQYVLGHRWEIARGLSLNTELYYQRLFDIPVNAQAPDSWSMINFGALPGATNTPNTLGSSGIGRNAGVDFTLEQQSRGGWNALLTTSLFQSQYAGSDDIWRSTAWNGNYVVNALLGRQLTWGRHGLRFDWKANWQGGRRYTPIDLNASREVGQPVYLHEQDFSERYPDYFKMDFRVAYDLTGKRFDHQFALDFQNITGRQNILYETYSPSTEDLKTVYQLGFIPVFQYRVFFGGKQ